MRLRIQVDPSKRAPLYRQLVGEIADQIALGNVKPEEQLPSVREMALRLGINPNTVARAYRELEIQGLVVSHQGKGVFVVSQLKLGRVDFDREVHRLLDRLLDLAQARGISTSSLISEIKRRGQKEVSGDKKS